MLTFRNDNIRLNFKLPSTLSDFKNTKNIVQIDIKVIHYRYIVEIWIPGYDNGVARVY